MLELYRLMEHKKHKDVGLEIYTLIENNKGGLLIELAEKMMMLYLEFGFGLVGKGDQQRTMLERERAKMENVLSWVSALIRYWS
ncbi:hypothetical protein FVEG_15583 [Fusarium verticillioides 7600]|uniref:Uncharacterized protein n=1 Tax=Gibberella moniliformis (strain M3125 / FGSC 7600) TaxID=334819 RepID=W7MFP6_GIBM7|nr:hypothetical protein FVEG_15583 [Fusarium verticillioides 7600]EWG43592.1 hypothetical protein FVEG_15583 [Fusarium verticillioides 7600]